jgi:hypothetical protein
MADAEALRLQEDKLNTRAWKRWGPYVSERSWGTVREDYSPDGSAWNYFPHDHARSRAYRWGEDGLAGVCDRYQILVFALALWNGRDPILKERLFGLTPAEANHGEDVKEYYFYLDSTPTHSYMKWLYKYPQAAYPYGRLIEENRGRSTREPEFELLDTGIFDEDRYFDVFVEYAKSDPEDLCIRIEVCNRGPEDAAIHVLPQLWFRNTWSWGAQPQPEPIIRVGPTGPRHVCLEADEAGLLPTPNLPFEYRLGKRYLYGDAGGAPLFTNNETHNERVWGPHAPSRTPFVKDAFHRHIIDGEACVNSDQVGTKAALHYSSLVVPAGGSVVLRLRFTDKPLINPLADVDAIVAQRRGEADAFYDGVHPPKASAEERRVQRQALAGMLWTKQVYLFDVNVWLEGDNPDWPPPSSRRQMRNARWRHLNSMRILSMPDKWEYPWFAAWDLAFHTLPLALVDSEFAKQQLWLLLFEQFQHVNGQVPAYEWEFSDLNPPVHAWAVWRIYSIERKKAGQGDRGWLEMCFHKLLINFAWWVNKVDADGHNVFEGGFLGLDNITIFDRSEKLGPGASLKQSDATGWMGTFCLNLMRIALELATDNPAYGGLATKFFQHFVHIGAAMNRKDQRDFFELWSERDGFFYDVLRYPDGTYYKIRARSMVGLIPLYAVEQLDEDELARHPDFRRDLLWFLKNRPAMVEACVTSVQRNGRKVYLLSLLAKGQLERVLTYVWDPAEFRSDHGLRSLSKEHETHPFRLGDFHVPYEAGEALATLKGGNSNWRGPVWFPTNFLLIETLRNLATAHGSSLKIPAAEGEPVTLDQMARGLADRLIALFTPDAKGRRPIYADCEKFQTDPHWRNCLLFHEYFHGDTGKGLGAIHQTGWTGLVATLIDEWRR